MNRLKEPSTWAGLAAVAQMLKGFVPPQYHVLLDATTAATGALAAGLPERGKP
jgi:hypothetical protein